MTKWNPETLELVWTEVPGPVVSFQECIVGDFYNGDGVRFSLEKYLTCYRRGPWKMLVEVAEGLKHRYWGCFDEQDQPMRWYHHEESAKKEALAIAKVLLSDRLKTKIPIGPS